MIQIEVDTQFNLKSLNYNILLSIHQHDMLHRIVCSKNQFQSKHDILLKEMYFIRNFKNKIS